MVQPPGVGRERKQRDVRAASQDLPSPPRARPVIPAGVRRNVPRSASAVPGQEVVTPSFESVKQQNLRYTQFLGEEQSLGDMHEYNEPWKGVTG